jgi:uncharacterized membrane protein YoaK (UPF0700 family)
MTQTRSTAWQPLGEVATAAALAFTAGYVDTLGFVALFGLFTSHVTGNFVLIGSELAHASGNVLLKLLAFPAFVIAVVSARFVVLRFDAADRPSMRVLLILQTLLLGLFALFGVLGAPFTEPEAPLAIAAGLSGAAAMGVQNAAARLVLPSGVPTTVMTGNVTQLVIDAVDIARGSDDPVLRTRSRRIALPIAGFAIGAMGGAFGYVFCGFAGLLAPIAVLIAVSLQRQNPPGPP